MAHQPPPFVQIGGEQQMRVWGEGREGVRAVTHRGDLVWLSRVQPPPDQPRFLAVSDWLLADCSVPDVTR